MFKNALVSVSNKEGLANFLKPLVSQGLRIVSTGGTATYLKEQGFSIVDVSEQTKFPEVMGGRVKTLHPMVHMPILARADFADDFELLKKNSLEAFDLVICNLYPFEQTLSTIGDQKLERLPELVEKIDIGGPTLLRAAAKNFQRVTVICDPTDYNWINQKTKIEIDDRKRLAAKVFAHTSTYDALIAQTLEPGFTQQFSVPGRKVQELRYGENPQQSASWYEILGQNKGLQKAEILQGKALSYNNLLDIDAAAALVRQFHQPCAVAVKHNNPCGVAIADSISQAVEKSLAADPVSVFGGIIALNKEVDSSSAQQLEKVFLECIVAPKFSLEAKEIFSRKKNLRLLEWSEMMADSESFQIKKIAGGFLLQTEDRFTEPIDWNFLNQMPSSMVLQDMIFGDRVCSYLKSNAIAIVGGGQTLGLGMGQVNRVDAVEQAILRMKKFSKHSGEKVLVSDAFFPFPDSVELAAQAGIRWILQPGGSVKDQDVLNRAKELGVCMVLTGQRHFRH
jgi:phosphoribosylaminoimidazolecarboxamide formyltransferase/IMP cyclohydrolase